MTVPRVHPRRSSLRLALCALLGASACGGGGRGGAPPPATGLTTGLSMAPPVASVAPPDPGFPEDADYFLDPLREEVEDPSLVGLRRLNALLDSLGRSGSDALVGVGPYGAQQRIDALAPGADTDAARRRAGRSLAWTRGGFPVWVLDRARPSGAAQELAAWFDESEAPQGDQTVFLEATLMRDPGPGYPFGALALRFTAAADATFSVPFVRGALATSGGVGAGFTYFEAKGDVERVPAVGEQAEEVQAALALDANGTSGRARLFRRRRGDDGSGDSGILPEEWLLAFDDTHLLRGRDGGAPEAFRRDDPLRYVWRYGLYVPDGPDAGRRDVPRLGLGVRTAGGERGWYEEGQLWLPSGVTVGDGDELVQDEPGVAVPERYTVRTPPGRLTRMTPHPLDLTLLGDEPFQWLEHDPGAGTTHLHVVLYDDATGNWSRHATFDAPSGRFLPLVPPQVIDVAALGALSLHADALGGPVAYVHGAPHVLWFDVEVVDGSDAVFAGGASELELFGFVDALRSGIDAAQGLAGDVYLPPAPGVAAPYRYVLDRADLTLRRDVNGDGSLLEEVTFLPGAAPSTGGYAWGVRSGPLLEVGVVPASVPGAWDAPVHYQWETGPHAWNRFTGLVRDAGDFVEPVRATRFVYRHDAANDRNGDASQHGRTFVLAWTAGAGLRGIPRRGLDADGDGTNDRWVPVVNLVDGLRLGPPGAERILRALAIEQVLRPEPAYAGTLDLQAAGDLVVPDDASHALPSLGAAPVLAEPPLVVDGVERDPGA